MKKFSLLFIIFANIVWAQSPVNLTPVFAGYIRSLYQSDFSTNQGQFLVKEARLGVNGNVNEYASYKILVDFTRLGSLSTTTAVVNGTKVVTSATSSFSDILCDAYATVAPMKDLSFSAGQFVVPTSSENLTSGADLDFINRGITTSVLPDLRDIGLVGSYSNKDVLPVEVKAAVLNGSGQNKTENDKTSNYALRAVVHPVTGLGLSANYYGGRISGATVKIFDLGADFKLNKLLFSGEFGQRNSTLASAQTISNAFFVYSVYDFDFGQSFISHILPGVRYENYDPSTSVSGNKLDKYTAGLTFEFAKIKYAHFRINYEKYNYQGGKTNPNKLLFELQTRF